ncbi:hypothetical protein LY78DRAFT_700503 [Colletotrichum sublineola]|nr:hypothetical protein LY78DRAFT_700503 [Colletotrichum sublineola]
MFHLPGDKSIFASSSEGQEVALRRAELLVNGKNETVSGHKTWHISLRTDPTRPLNYTHEYVLVFHEAQDFQADFCSVKTGSHLEDNPPTSQKMLRVEGYKFDVPVKTFFETPLTDDLVVPPTFNNISGIAPTTLGETHFGLQKRPVGANLQNFLFNGTQPSGINEAMFFSGIFQDDSSTGCVTL